MLTEIRWHGRGGQGAVTSALLLAHAVIKEGGYAQSFAEFGPERRGAPLVAFTRIDEHPINLRCNIYNPDVAIILDPKLITSLNVTKGLKKEGKIIVNTSKTPQDIKKILDFTGTLATVNATKIALEELGVPIVNTAMLGSAIKVLKAAKLETAIEAIQERFQNNIAERNVNAARRAFNETKIIGAE
jgi:2-oxoacid:acceptor oxidoreductase gamma subunit (pyruvate/2-ketoisovalerate family)